MLDSPSSLRSLLLHAATFAGLLSAGQTAELASTAAPIVSGPGLSPAAWTKPVWLSDLSLGVKASYDDNVFLSGADAKYLPAAYTVPEGSAVALKDQGSWVTTVSPKLGLDVAPLLGRGEVQTLALSYSPDFAFFHGTPSEDFKAHRIGNALKVKTDSLTLAAENNFLYVDGDRMGPFYPGGLLSAIGIGAPRERREQIQDRASFALQYNRGPWFVRPAASLLYYDLMTDFRNVTGYMNYVDRYDVNGGADLGYRFTPGFGASLGYRYGHQYQQSFDFSPYSSSSDYQRMLVGCFGQPWKWLQFNILAGPDFRSYPADSPTHLTPVNDKHPVYPYGEASLTAKVTSRDSLTLIYKQFMWVSSIGKVPYFDSGYGLTYDRRLTERIGLSLGGRLATADYTSGNLSNCRRNDWQYTVSFGVSYALSAHANLSLVDTLDLGRNAEDEVVNPETREYRRNLVSLTAGFKF